MRYQRSPVNGDEKGHLSWVNYKSILLCVHWLLDITYYTDSIYKYSGIKPGIFKKIGIHYENINIDSCTQKSKSGAMSYRS